MATIRTALFYVVFLVGTMLLLLPALLASPLSPGVARWFGVLWGGWFRFSARLLLGIHLVVRGRVPQQGVLVAFKHQSWYEAILTLHLFRYPAVVMKAELRRIPFWGYLAARHGSIFVERAHGTSALRSMLRNARAHAAAGRPILIFPEGTRVAVGSAPPLKAGLYALYGGLGLPLVPVALDAGRCWPKGFAKRPGTVTISFLPDIPPGLSRVEMEARVFRAINEEPHGCVVRA